MLHRWIDGKKGLLLVPYDSQDLWTLRRIIAPGDAIQSRTTREVKLEGEYQRPDKGRRVTVRVRLEVESIRYDFDLGRLRIRGRITESDNELVPHGSYHSVEVQPLTEISLWRKDYPSWLMGLLSRRVKADSFLLVAADSREAGVGLLTGVSLKLYGTVESGLSGKLYAQDHDKLSRTYFRNVIDLIRTVLQSAGDANVVLAGPGNVKNQLNNALKASGVSWKVFVLEGFDLAGEEGVRLLLSNSALRELLSKTEYGRVQGLVEEVKVRLAKDDPRIAMGVASCSQAAGQGAVESLLLSDGVFKAAEEDKVIRMANEVEAKRGEVFLIDSSTVLGSQVDGLGGSVALLRYSLEWPT